MGDQPVARPSPAHRTAKHRINAHNRDTHALSGIRNHDPSVRATEDSSCLRPCGYCERPHSHTVYENYKAAFLITQVYTQLSA
jgi:hypothetical protein